MGTDTADNAVCNSGVHGVKHTILLDYNSLETTLMYIPGGDIRRRIARLGQIPLDSYTAVPAYAACF